MQSIIFTQIRVVSLTFMMIILGPQNGTHPNIWKIFVYHRIESMQNIILYVCESKIE